MRHPDFPDRYAVRDIWFHVREGEVVGIAGLMGAGRTELAMCIFGRSYGGGISETARISGQPVRLNTVSEDIAAGLAYVTEDRNPW